MKVLIKLVDAEKYTISRIIYSCPYCRRVTQCYNDYAIYSENKNDYKRRVNDMVYKIKSNMRSRLEQYKAGDISKETLNTHYQFYCSSCEKYFNIVL